MKRLTLAIALAALLVPALPISAAGSGSSGRAVRSGHSGRVVRSGHRRGFVYWRRPYYWGWGYAPYWYDPFWYGYGPYGGYYGGGYYGRYAVSRDWAVVDTDVSPESARVYLDGQLLGTADDFDGYPDYLYLRRGQYRLEFRLDGYQPRTVSVDARPGTKLDVGEKLPKIPGAARYGSYEEAVPSGSVRRFWGKRRDVAESITDEDAIYGSERRRMRERPYDDRDRYDDDEREYDRGEEGRDPDDRAWRDRRDEDQRDEGRPGDGRLRFRVDPADAAIYVDDRFVGTAAELDGDGGVAIAPGRHTVIVARPGYRDRRLEIDVSQGEIERIEVTLER